MKPTIQIMNVTPEAAKSLLENNPRNRIINKSTVSNYASAMLAGDWKMNGEAIQVADNGQLLNGQHRLSAVIKSGMTIPFLMVIGLSPDTFSTYDQGKKRSVSDVLGIRGEKYATSLASGAKYMFLHKTFGNPFYRTTAASPDAIVRTIDEHPKLREFAAKVGHNRAFCKTYIRGGPATFCMTLFDEADSEAAALFFEELETGTNLSPLSPARALRERLLMDSKTNPLTDQFRMALVFKSFRMYRADEPCKVLRMNFGNEEDRYRV